MIDANAVRCKDCKYGKEWRNKFGINGVKCVLFCADVGANAFCCYGKRRYDNATD